MKKIIFVAGHRGMVGSAIIRHLERYCSDTIITRSHAALDLTNQGSVAEFFAQNQIDEAYLAAAKVGGICANEASPAEFIYQNLMIEANIIHAAYASGVRKLLFFGSSCIYPKLAVQPMGEDALLTGVLEPTNEPYAVAKIAGIRLCESYNRQYGVDFRCVMPTNLYGPNDNFHLEDGHVVPALMRRFHDAKLQDADKVVVWGSGTPRREFLHVDDMAAASVHVMNLPQVRYQEHIRPPLSHVNVGTGVDLTILDLAETIATIVGFRGRIEFDTNKPDGTPQKLLDVSLLAKMGWEAKTSLEDGLRQTYVWFLQNWDRLRA